jgi:NAD-dependent DNA ligase
MGSLNQKYEGETIKWVEKHALQDEDFIITDKLDGTSGLTVYDAAGNLQIGYSKGDGFEGADITRHLSKFKSIPQHIPQGLVVRGEVILSYDNFTKVQQLVMSRTGKPYKNARNMVAGIMNASINDPVVYDYLDYVVYDIPQATISKNHQLDKLDEFGFNTPHSAIVKGKQLTDEFLSKYLNDRRSVSQYEIDGLVIEVNKNVVRQKINPTKDTLNPEFAIKYKIADASNIATTTVIEVEWNLSKDGYYKPRVKVEPIKLVGVTIQHATGFNAKFIKDNQIGPGARVQITRSGDVIPYLVACVEPSDNVELPDGIWTDTGVDLVAHNASENATVRFEQLNDFFMSIDAPHLREGNLQLIFDAGFETPEAVITMTLGEFQSLLGKANGKKVFDGIKSKLTNIQPYTLMGAFPGFGRGVGERKFKKLYEAFAGEWSKCDNFEAIVAVHGFDDKTATKIVNGYSKYLTFLVDIFNHITLAPYEAPKTGNLTGKTYVFTGFRDPQLEKRITDAGGKVGTSVSSKTTAVIAADPEESSGKIDKAKALGIQIIPRAQFNEV